ncbi:MAG: hypothetical protein KatS3mg032_1277 [Cyclobacteriaceae bacterium]|nr:MAG: hypothetical protein KatS3mg032_1277 [Cyclobacteriaceae bacterium]
MNKTPLLIFLFVIFAFGALSQATFTSTGNWDNAANWSGSNIGDNVNENVTINANQVANIRSGFTYTIGNLTFGNNAGLTINNGGTLNVGDASNTRNVTANNNNSITVAGTLVIWGDLIVNNNLSLTITGTMIVKGNIVMNNNASLSVSGSLTVEGNFNANNNTNVTITGSGGISVGGTVSVGNNSNLTGPDGSFTVAGGCTQGSGSNFCTSSTLPVRLLFFQATTEGNAIVLSWATEKEEGFDYFDLEKASSDFVFTPIARIRGAGYDIFSRRDYMHVDAHPYAGTNYYRLKAVDLDGSFEYFRVVSARYETEPSVEIYPNPVTGNRISYRVDFNPSPGDKVMLMDLHGRPAAELVPARPGINEHVIEGLNPGIYIFHYAGQGFRKSLKVIVQ